MADSRSGGVTDDPNLAFDFASAGRIVFGRGVVRQLPTLVGGLGRRVFICSGSRPETHQELFTSIAGVTDVFPVRREPTVDDLTEALRRAGDAEVVVGIGGGSVIDLAKGVAMLLGNGGDPLDYLEVVGRGVAITRPSAPLIAVPTTAGTGAEVTSNAVFTSPSHRVKCSLRSPFMLPRIALVDPLLTVGCPPAVTAASGLDALTQCIEPFVSRFANPLTDGFATTGLRLAGHALRRAFLDGSDGQARTDMSMVSLLGGLALANARLGAVHGLAGPLGGLLSAPHGAVCAALLPSVIRANVAALSERGTGSPELLKYEMVAQLLTDDPHAPLSAGVAWIEETVGLLGVGGLGSLGLTGPQVDGIVAQSFRSSSMKGNPVDLTEAGLRQVVLQAM